MDVTEKKNGEDIIEFITIPSLNRKKIRIYGDLYEKRTSKKM